MTTANRESRLVNALNLEEKDLPDSLDRIYHRRRKSVLGVVLRFAARHALTKGMVAYYIDKDVAGFKQWFYVASKVKLASAGQPGGEAFNMRSPLQYALLSDNAEVIDAMARVTTKALHDADVNSLANQFHVRMLQLAILGDDEALRIRIQKLAKHGKNPDRKAAAAGRDFYTLLLNRDKAALEDLIQNKDSKVISSDVLFEDFMSSMGVWETKLCWRRGLEVQIDSPLVPMELMPVRPLEHYDDVYDFLKPGWVPPPQGLLADAVRWIRKRV